MTVDVRIQGQSVPFLFDTGGGISLVTPGMAEQLGCQPFGRLVGYRMQGERVDFGRCDDVSLEIESLVMRHEALGIFDLNSLLPPTWPKLGGMVTLSSFEGSLVSVDLSARQVTISNSELSPDDSVPLRFVRQASGYSLIVLVPVETSRGTLWLELDSGSTVPLLLAPHAATALGLAEAEGATGEPSPTIAPQEVSLPLHNVGDVPTVAKVGDFIYDGNIGAPLMAKLRWHLDLKNGRVRIERP